MVLCLACLFLFLGAGNQGDLFISQSVRSLVLLWDCDQGKRDLQRYPGIDCEITMAERGMLSHDSGQKVAEKRKKKKEEKRREESETRIEIIQENRKREKKAKKGQMVSLVFSYTRRAT